MAGGLLVVAMSLIHNVWMDGVQKSMLNPCNIAGEPVIPSKSRLMT